MSSCHVSLLLVLILHDLCMCLPSFPPVCGETVSVDRFAVRFSQVLPWCATGGGTQPDRLSSGHSNLLSLVVHCGTLCKANMAASCARVLGKVGWSFLESSASRSSGAFSYLLRNVGAHGFRTAYGTGAAGVRSKLLSGARSGGGRVLGCAFLLGGGLGLYQTVKMSVQQHLAEEERKVS